jgi:hypothetical protein
MATSRKQFSPYPETQAKSPIKFVTENGFSIIRSSDLDPSVINTAGECRFLVQGESGSQREIKVGFSDDLIASLRIRRRGALSHNSLFWLVCAESHLATYLGEKNGHPPGDGMTINELSPDELMLVIHWRDKE